MRGCAHVHGIARHCFALDQAGVDALGVWKCRVMTGRMGVSEILYGYWVLSGGMSVLGRCFYHGWRD